MSTQGERTGGGSNGHGSKRTAASFVAGLTLALAGLVGFVLQVDESPWLRPVGILFLVASFLAFTIEWRRLKTEREGRTDGDDAEC